MLTPSEQNYIKAIYKISEGLPPTEWVNTNAIAELMNNRPASVTDMIKKLAEKGHLHYEPYTGVKLSDMGMAEAKKLIRKHRLWETFLYDKLGFSWDEVHQLAEELEHIESEKLTDRLDDFLGHPSFDPHGDPIPDKYGAFPIQSEVLLLDMRPGDKACIVGVKLHSTEFLQFLDSLDLRLGSHIEFLLSHSFDDSTEIATEKNKRLILSSKVGRNVLVQLIPGDSSHH